MAVVAEEVDQHVTEIVVTEQRASHRTVRLPPVRIVFVPFSLVEIDLVPDNE